jgi:hypothetical protein
LLPSVANQRGRGAGCINGLAGFEFAAVLHDRTGHCHPPRDPHQIVALQPFRECAGGKTADPAAFLQLMISN